MNREARLQPSSADTFPSGAASGGVSREDHAGGRAKAVSRSGAQTIELARTSDEVSEAARVLLRSFDGHENARLGFGYAGAVLHEFLESPERTLHIARLGGRVVGFAAGEPSSLRAERYRNLRPAAAVAVLTRPWVLADGAILRMARQRLLRQTEEALPLSWFLALIAVAPEAEGRGLGRDLLSAFEEAGALRGFDVATLFVRDDNVRARAMYERAGWSASGEIRLSRVTYAVPLGR